MMKRNCLLISFTIFVFFLSSCKNDTLEPSGYDLEILDAVNAHRNKLGLRTLEHDDFIWKLAREHSEYMANAASNANHDGIDERYTKISEHFGIGTHGENVSSGEGTAAQVLAAWLGSVSHKETLEGNFKLTGLSAVKAEDGTWYYTQIFFNQ
ncbi:MAG: CAP domain-containing protein [Bacteroidales bacterium]|nr:CAP domain-containing protein [Bacteroidales bacterium]